MEYLQAALSLRSLIGESNSHLLTMTDTIPENPHLMRIKMGEENIKELVMETFSNEYVTETLNKMGDTEAFVVTDLVTMNVNGKEMTYLLYKGYHSQVEKGMVFYQIVDEKDLSPVGKLQFSNTEENIFYEIDEPGDEESSCNALETNKKDIKGKGIVFLIGHTNEERLVYDIQRLIFDTVNNVTKHPKLHFTFIINISHFGGTPSDGLKEQVKAIDELTRNEIYPLYSNVTFEFSFEEGDE
ncbi:MAG: hypothetical protein PQJ59_12760 [Spirochaetales bacterium]|nr:hypothetical protein [Spirochaetales bacterium]